MVGVVEGKKSQFVGKCVEAGDSNNGWPVQLLVSQSRESGGETWAEVAHGAGDLIGGRILAGFAECSTAIEESAPAGVDALAEHLEDGRPSVNDVSRDPEHGVGVAGRGAP